MSADAIEPAVYSLLRSGAAEFAEGMRGVGALGEDQAGACTLIFRVILNDKYRYDTAQWNSLKTLVNYLRKLQTGMTEPSPAPELVALLSARATLIDAALKAYFQEHGLDVSGFSAGEAVVAGGLAVVGARPAVAPEPVRVTTADASPEKPISSSALADADRDFGARLFDKIAGETDIRDNVFFSPFGIAGVLQILLNGAQGETLEKMSEALSLRGLDPATIGGAYAVIARELRQADPTGARISLANSAWVKESVRLREAVRAMIEKNFGGEIGVLKPGMEQEINEWIARKTENMITDLLANDSIDPMTAILLVNAIYFDGKWARPFEPHLTQDRNFHGVFGPRRVPMMTQTTRFQYMSERDYETIFLPYGNGLFRLCVVLPRATLSAEEFTLNQFRGGLLLRDCIDCLSNARLREGSITLPKFKARQRIDLKEVLTALGMGIAFDQKRADFMGLAESGAEPGLFLSQVLHEAVVEVDERGTRAAAVTTASAKLLSYTRPTEPFNMVVERPFFYSIMHVPTAMPLFMGYVNAL